MENQEKEKKNKNTAVTVVTVFLVLCILFSAVQTLYIFALTTGRIGNMSYTPGIEIPEKTEDGSDMENVNAVSPYADPCFSLEEAASVTDPDKQTLSTMEIASSVGPATVSVFIIGNSSYTGQQGAISAGSGFIISADGYVVTNAHVVDAVEEDDTKSIKIMVPGYDDLIDAKIVGTDEQTDIAVIKLMEGEDYPCVTLGDSDVLQVGELAVVIGNPLGTLDGTVTVGVVSALERRMNNNGYTMKLIQTDASINEGNSGGPLINSFGEVVGVTNAKMNSAEGLGFAIPISDVKSVIESLINYGYVANRPYLGITVNYVTSNAYYGAVQGVYVAELAPGGPGDQAGVRVGDRIISFDGVEIEQSSDIIDIRDSHSVGDEVPLVVERDGRNVELTLTIGDSSISYEDD
ncbi:MAG: trypsin-like peptidase domain-containing protein [Clostridiales bacterium]|nr:trypsin-like peptidase domain-containing protein [Clostridiales bacterium]